MPKLGYYEAGTYNACCDQCGRGFKFYSLRKRWDGAWTCSSCWEIRQPQDFVRAVRDDQFVPVARPRILPSGSSPFMFWTNGPSQVQFTNLADLMWTN